MEGFKLTMDIKHITPGTIIVLKGDHASLAIGTRGVCYEIDHTRKHPVASFLFQGGILEDISSLQQDKIEEIGFSEALQGYKFHNYATILSDYKRGVFDAALRQF